MRTTKPPPWVLEAAFALATFAFGAVAAILLGAAGVVVSLGVLFAVGALVGSHSGRSWVVPGVPGMAIGVVVLVVGLPLARQMQSGTAGTAEAVALLGLLAALVIGGLLVPGALIGRGQAQRKPGLTAVGCLVPTLLALVIGAILSSFRLPGA